MLKNFFFVCVSVPSSLNKEQKTSEALAKEATTLNMHFRGLTSISFPTRIVFPVLINVFWFLVALHVLNGLAIRTAPETNHAVLYPWQALCTTVKHRTYGHISSTISRNDRLPTGPDALLTVLCLLSVPHTTNDYLMTGLNATLFGAYIYIAVCGRSKNYVTMFHEWNWEITLFTRLFLE